MSESSGNGSATFSQPASATQGLQRYNIERGTKRLTPGLLAGRLAARALLSNRSKRALRQRKLAKGDGMAGEQQQGAETPDELQAMLAALRGSVSTIVASGGDIDAALEKSFGEFEGTLRGAVQQEIDQVEADAGAEVFDPLFKGLGCVGRLASLAKMTADQVELIKVGQDYRGSDRMNDPASDDVSSMLDSGLHCFELALRSAVNAHVGPVDDSDDMDNPAPGIVYVHVPDPDDPDNDDAGAVVKSTLPMDLAKFATFPEQLAAEAMTLGGSLMLVGGMPEGELEKLFGGGGALAKFSPPGGDAGGAPGDGTDPTMDPTDPNAMPPDDGSQDDPLDVLGRILAAGMIQLDHIRQMLEGGDGADGATPGDGTDPTMDPTAGPDATGGAPAQDPASAPPPASAGDAPPPKKKPTFGKMAGGGGMEKFVSGGPAVAGAAPGMDADLMRRVAAIESTVPLMAEMAQTLKKIAERPAAVQAPMLFDTTGGLAKAEGMQPADLTEALAKMSPEQVAEASIRASHKRGF